MPILQICDHDGHLDMDYCIITGKDSSQIESAIEGISAKFEIAGEGEMDEYTLEGKWNK